MADRKALDRVKNKRVIERGQIGFMMLITSLDPITCRAAGNPPSHTQRELGFMNNIQVICDDSPDYALYLSAGPTLPPQ